MHKQIYCHKVVKIIDRMISDILLSLYETNSKYFNFKNILNNNLDYFCTLTDDIFDKIEFIYNFDKKNIDNHLENAYTIYQRIKNRDLYTIHKKINYNENNLEDYICKYDYVNYSYLKSTIGYLPNKHPLNNIKIYNNKGILNNIELKEIISNLIFNNFYENNLLIFKK